MSWLVSWPNCAADYCSSLFSSGTDNFQHKLLAHWYFCSFVMFFSASDCWLWWFEVLTTFILWGSCSVCNVNFIPMLLADDAEHPTFQLQENSCSKIHQALNVLNFLSFSYLPTFLQMITLVIHLCLCSFLSFGRSKQDCLTQVKSFYF